LGAGFLIVRLAAVFFAAVFFAAVFLAAALATEVVGACAIGRDGRCGSILRVVAMWVTHEEQRPSRSALSSLATSIGPSSVVPQ
jgi:hypothetical protein